MDKCSIDIDRLTKEAEAGHGHFVKAVLDEMSFQDRLLTLQQVQKLSEEHRVKNPEAPYLKVKTGTDLQDVGIRLNRYVPRCNLLFGLLDGRDVLYEDMIMLPSGRETITDTDIFEKRSLGL